MTDFQWIKPDVEVTHRPDGTIILQNKVPLASYLANLCVWLRENAQKFPQQTFLAATKRAK